MAGSESCDAKFRSRVERWGKWRRSKKNWVDLLRFRRWFMESEIVRKREQGGIDGSFGIGIRVKKEMGFFLILTTLLCVLLMVMNHELKDQW